MKQRLQFIDGLRGLAVLLFVVDAIKSHAAP
jgi:uncharacterized membrane protein